MTSSRTRFRLALAAIALLLMAAGGLVVRGFTRRVAHALSPASGTPARGGGESGGGSVMERVLSRAVRFGSIEYQGGTSARLQRLQIPIGAAGGATVEVPTADLELDVQSMSLKGVMDGAPIARGLLGSKLSILELEAGAKLPINLSAPAGSIGNFKTWNMSANLAGQKVMFRPSTFLESVPLQVANGKIAYEKGAVRLSGVQLAFGASKLAFDAGVALDGAPVFDPSQVTGSLDVMDLLMPKGTARPKDARSQVAVNIAVSGPAERPDVKGDVNGEVRLDRVPIARDTAGVADRFVNLRFPKVVGRVSGGRDGVLLSAEVITGKGSASVVSPSRELGFVGEQARALTTVDGSWTAPRIVQSLELTRGVVHYAFDSKVGSQISSAAFDFPYESMRLSTSTRQKQLSYHFDAVSPGGGQARFDFELDRSRKPAVNGYGLETEGVDVALLTAPLWGSALVARGRLSLKANGTANRMAVVDMKGAGKGRFTGFSLDWTPSTGSLEDLDLADLIRTAVVPVVEVTAPSFGREVVLEMKGQARGFRLEGLLRVNANLGYIGKFDYTFDPTFLSGNAAGERALLRRAGGSGRLSLKVKGQSPLPPVIELAAP